MPKFQFHYGKEIEIWEHQSIFCIQNTNYSQVPWAIYIFRQCLNKVFSSTFTQTQKKFHLGSTRRYIFKWSYFPLCE